MIETIHVFCFIQASQETVGVNIHLNMAYV